MRAVVMRVRSARPCGIAAGVFALSPRQIVDYLLLIVNF